MSTNKNDREYDRDKEMQNKAHDQKEQSQEETKNQERPKLGKDGERLLNPEYLQNNDHKMDKRTSSSVDIGGYGRDVNPGDSDSNNRTESRWNEIHADYRKSYPNVTDDDVYYKSGEFDDMTERIAKRTDRNREEVNKEIREWNSSDENI